MRFFFLIPCLALFSNPNGMNLVSGQVKLSASKPHLLEIETSDQTVLYWDAFSIEANECTRFIQSSSRSVVLNRVVGSDVSRIDGVLESNGSVFLLNPSGILIGKTASLNSESFFFSAFPLSDQAFLNRSLEVGDEGGRILNEGGITARSADVWISGREVDQSGRIDAVLGRVCLASFDNVSNQGTISAGEISVSVPHGTVDVAGSILADGERNGGKISIFSDSTSIHPTGKLSAQGAERGGSIILKAETDCSSMGRLLAEGGFIEVSGKRGLHLGGEIKAGSLSRPGQLLIDPTDIDIGVGSTTPPPFAFPPSDMQFDRPGPTAFLNISDLESQLQNGVSVTIQTTPGAGGMGRIRVLSPIGWNQGTNLTLIADENIHVLADIENFGNGSLTFNAAQDLLVQSGSAVGARVIAQSGNIDITAANAEILSGGAPAGISTAEGEITLHLSGDLTLSGGMGPETDASAMVRGGRAVLDVAGSLWLTGGSSARSSVEVRASSDLELQIGGTLNLQGGSGLEASALIMGGESLTMDVGLDASVISSLVSQARIGSDFGSGQIDVGTSAASTLTLTGLSAGKEAKIDTHTNLSLSSSLDIVSSLAHITSRTGSLTIQTINEMNLSQQSLISSFYLLDIQSGLLTADASKISAIKGGLSIVSTGSIGFQNGSEISSFPTALFQGTTFGLNQSIYKAIGSLSMVCSGAVSFVNSNLFHFPNCSVDASSWTIDQSTVHLTRLDSNLSGSLTVQNDSLLNIDNSLGGTAGALSLSSSSIKAGDAEFDGGATSLLNAVLSFRETGFLSGTTLSLNESVIESSHSTLELIYANNAQLINSTISAISDCSATFDALSMDQSTIRSTTSSQTIILTNAATLTNQSLLRSGRLLTITGTGLDLASSSISSLIVDLNLSDTLSLSANSSAIAPVSFKAVLGMMANLNLSSIQGKDIAISGPALQMTDSMIQASQSFKIQVPNLTLMNSEISDPYSFLQN